MRAITKKLLFLVFIVLTVFVVIGCQQTTETTSTTASTTQNQVITTTTNLDVTTTTTTQNGITDTGTSLTTITTFTTAITTEVQPVTYPLTLSLPSTELLEQTTPVSVVEGAPDLMIIGLVLDTYYYYHYETMSGFEYVKIFNNTLEDYNLKDHRIVLTNPLQGQNYEDEEARVGNKSLMIGYLFNGLIDEDFVIPPLSVGLVWLKPYYWTAGSGTGAYNKIFSTALIHKDTDKPGAFSQDLDDFKEFWQLEESDVPVYELTNMGLVSKREAGGTEDFFPIFSPGAGTPYTHLNSALLRSIEIQKFDDQGGTATIDLLNKYSELSPEKQAAPDPIYSKIAFNVMEIRDNDEVQEIYTDYENGWKYFKPVVRANFAGLINTAEMSPGQTEVDFLSTSSPGIAYWPNTTELQFRPPLTGERIMQLQLPLREYAKLETYMMPIQFGVMRYSTENVVTYRFVDKTILLAVNPEEVFEINWREDEVYSDGRMSGASPSIIHLINLTRPVQ